MDIVALWVGITAVQTGLEYESIKPREQARIYPRDAIPLFNIGTYSTNISNRLERSDIEFPSLLAHTAALVAYNLPFVIAAQEACHKLF